jgi:hypothetical protein
MNIPPPSRLVCIVYRNVIIYEREYVAGHMLRFPRLELGSEILLCGGLVRVE